MPDTTFNMVVPDLKAKDLGDGTFAMSIGNITIPGGGTDTVFPGTDPPIKAIDTGEVDSNGDKIYAVAAVLV